MSSKPRMNSRINRVTEMIESARAAMDVNQGGMPVKSPMEIFSKAAISMMSALSGKAPKKAPGARENSSTKTFPAPG